MYTERSKKGVCDSHQIFIMRNNSHHHVYQITKTTETGSCVKL